MVTWLMNNRINAFERKLGYDRSYVRAMLDTDRKAFFPLAKATQLGTCRRDVPREVAGVPVAVAVAERAA